MTNGNRNEQILLARSLHGRPEQILPVSALKSEKVYARWEKLYRNTNNHKFFKAALETSLAPLVNRTEEVTVLDAGCGTGTKSLLLADMGFAVTAVDISSDVLKIAKKRAEELGHANRVRFLRQDIGALDFEPASFDAIVCWGVLMHAEDVPKIVEQFSRVLRTGGLVLISEGNCRSFQSRIARFLRSIGLITGRQQRETLGLEIRKNIEQGQLLIRHMDIEKLIRLLEGFGFILRARRPGQFTEAYTLWSHPRAVACIHAVNKYWNERIGLAGPAFGNILIFEKAASDAHPISP